MKAGVCLSLWLGRGFGAGPLVGPRGFGRCVAVVGWARFLVCGERAFGVLP